MQIASRPVRIILSLLALFIAGPTRGQEAIKCGSIPQVGADDVCIRKVLDVARDTRECRRIILGFSINDPACESQRIAANAERQARLYESDIAYQSCLSKAVAKKAIDKVQLSSWLACMQTEKSNSEMSFDELASYQVCRRDSQSDWQAICCSRLSAASKAVVADCQSRGGD